MRPGEPVSGDETTGATAGDPPTQGPEPDEHDDSNGLTSAPLRLHPRIRLLWVGRVAIGALFLGLVVTGLERAFLQSAAWLGPAVFTLIFVLGTVHAFLRYRIWRYRLRADSMFLERGVVTRVQTVVPYVRVQHVDSRRSALERILGLATTVVYTAGSRGADVAVPGLTPERAEDLQRRLKSLAIESEGEDAV